MEFDGCASESRSRKECEMMTVFGLGFMIVGLLIILLILIGLVVLVVWAVRRTTNPATNAGISARPQTAKEVLQQRYARGEITREQYQEMLQDLEG
jgi:putative membrane protein